MAKVFLDANWYIDVVRRSKTRIKTLDGYQVFFSPLSTHILFYVYGLKVPSEELNKIHQLITLVPITEKVLQHALKGPTQDLEDNLQLNSAIEVDSDVFLTQDKFLLKMGYFGKMEIKQAL